MSNTNPPPMPHLSISKDVATMIARQKNKLTTLIQVSKYLKKEDIVVKPTNPKINSKGVSVAIYSEHFDAKINLKKSIIKKVTQEILDMGYVQFDKGIEFFCYGDESFSIPRDLNGTRKTRIVLADHSLPDSIIPSKNSYLSGGIWSSLNNTGLSKLNLSTKQDYFRYALIHEFGHALHDLTLKEGVGASLFHKHSKIDAMTASQVSDYANTNKSEFVAEVFAGRMHGMAYNQEILRLYDNLGGPATTFAPPPHQKSLIPTGPSAQKKMGTKNASLPFLDNLKKSNRELNPKKLSFPIKNPEPYIDFHKAPEHNWDSFYYHKQPRKNKIIHPKNPPLETSAQKTLLKNLPVSGAPKIVQPLLAPIIKNNPPSITVSKNKLKF